MADKEMDLNVMLGMFKDAFTGIEDHDYTSLRIIADEFEKAGDVEFAAKLREMSPLLIEEDYWRQVQEAAGNIVKELLDNDPSDWESILEQELHEYQNTHHWVINDKLAAQVLLYTKHGSYAAFHLGHERPDQPTDDFPISYYAGAAFYGDVRQKIGEILEKEHDIDIDISETLRDSQPSEDEAEDELTVCEECGGDLDVDGYCNNPDCAHYIDVSDDEE
jgi:hypothetical protein